MRAAYSVGRALSIRSRQRASHSDEALHSIEQAARAVEKQVQNLDQIKTWSETIRGHGEKIADRVGKIVGGPEKVQNAEAFIAKRWP